MADDANLEHPHPEEADEHEVAEGHEHETEHEHGPEEEHDHEEDADAKAAPFIPTAEKEPWMDEDRRHSTWHGDGEDDWDGDSEEGSDWGSYESEEEDEDEEDEDEDEEEEEDEDEDEEEEEEEEEEEVEPEEDEEIVMMRWDLVNNYLIKKGLLKYLKKKNAYFQDRIYRTSVRKGMIIEADLKKDRKTGKKHKKKKRSKKDKDTEAENTDKDVAEDKPTEALEGADKTGKRKKSAALDRVGLPQEKLKGKQLQRTFGETFSMEVKYQKIVRKVIRILEDRKAYEEQHVVNLDKHAVRREEWREAHRKQLMSILAKIRNASEEAIDSNTGKRMPRSDTEQYCTEIIAIHKKLCSTMVKMYKCRRGLELSTKRLDESEVQGEGLQMLEYEQLRAENQTLKDRLSDRVKDVDNIKDKITHGVQILAHFRAKMYNMNQLISEGRAELTNINVDVYDSREKVESIMKRYERVKREEQHLMVESGLLDNAVLLRDYEKTHFEVMALKEDKRKLVKEIERGVREIADIRDRIHEIQAEFPLIMASRDELIKIKKAEKRRKTLFAQSLGNETAPFTSATESLKSLK